MRYGARMFWALLSLSQSFYYAPPTQVIQPSAEETTFVQIINDFRANLRLQPVASDERLVDAAQNHALWMSYHHLLTHVGPKPWWKSSTRMYAAGIPYGTLVGENIARGSYSAKNTFIQWFFSPEHLEGMMTPEYDHIGVSREGCEPGDAEWNCFWVTDFAELTELPNAQAQLLTEPSKEQIVEAAEKVIGPLDPKRKDFFLHPNTGDEASSIEDAGLSVSTGFQ
jgi:uncharacterized protein YkwD